MSRMIPKIPVTVERPWQKELADCITDPSELLARLNLSAHENEADSAARELFAMRVPRPFVAKMVAGDWHDPLFRQVYTQSAEFLQEPGFSHDPLDEQDNITPGILHKYQSRALLIVRGGCAINCRYCFRRHFPYGDNHLNKRDWMVALQHIRSDNNINEVILSGGDPLMAKDDFLAWLCDQISEIPHIRRLRIHTRLPVVIPSRVCEDLLAWINSLNLPLVMVLHINHANEIDPLLATRLQQLKRAGVTLLNQAVLLKGVNDSADALEALSERLFAAGVLPYYLHMLDKVQGAQHFDVSDERARELMAEIIRRLPGFLVPRLVREIAQPGKTPVDLLLHP
ncbi:EF-P beta-lysylation protein EpmB [Pseudobowmanella zhangzhouensis]|uniref:EF-P beta-lysylation protein EpmB n=1 Tax=Pseudobowmanella zhangzhouensis TaxID=1537679 RepID=UPI00361C36DC